MHKVNCLVLTSQAAKFWKEVHEDVLPFAPCPSLLSQARASMLYAHSFFPLPPTSNVPSVVFGKPANYTGKEGTAAFSHEAFSFNVGARQVKHLDYVAALGVRTYVYLDEDIDLHYIA